MNMSLMPTVECIQSADETLLYTQRIQLPFGPADIVYKENIIYALIPIKQGEEPNIKTLFPNTDLIHHTSSSINWEKLSFQNNAKIQVSVSNKKSHFQFKVLQELTKIPFGETRNYSAIAQSIGQPKAIRAVASAIGKNQIAWLIPCHRVIRSDGSIGGYRWGNELKIQLLEYEKHKV